MGEPHDDQWIDEKYDLVHAGLALAYLILSCVTCFSFLNVVMRRNVAPQHNVNARGAHHGWLLVLFYPVFLVGTMLRTTFFIMQPLVMENVMKVDNATNYLLNTLPSFVFFANYLIILFRWAEIYHNSYEIATVRFRNIPTVLAGIIVLMFSSVTGLYIADFLMFPNQDSSVSQVKNPIEAATSWYVVALYLGTSLGFIFYGVKLSRLISSPFNSHLIDYCRKVQRLTAIVGFVFSMRTAIIIYSLQSNVGLSGYWWFDGVYFGGLEIVPLIIMLYILKIRKKAKASTNTGYPYRDAAPTPVTPLINNAYFSQTRPTPPSIYV